MSERSVAHELRDCAWGRGVCLALVGGSWLSLAGCRPTEISEAQFQARGQTCYPYPVYPDAGLEGGSVRPELRIPDGCEKATESMPSAVPTGTDAPGGSSVGLIPLQTGGSSSGTGATSGTGAVPGNSGDAGVGDAGVPAENSGTGGSTTTSMPMVCDATKIFSAPAEMGGCSDTNGLGGCHEPGTGVTPDLFSPGVATRLLGGSSRLVPSADSKGDDCAFVAATDRIWIKPGYDESSSFLWKKITSDETSVPCGKPMPDDEPPLSDEAKQCIRSWIRWVAAGGR